MDKLVARSQSDIMSSWNSDSGLLVSVVCATYNQERYLANALDGFLAQLTSFPFEILVHDDASTDGTAAIIRSYHERYPEIIRPIIQAENQYSKGGFKPWVYAASHSCAQYIAVCEGDDYWIVEDKLQRQIDALDENENVDFSFHSAFELTEGQLLDHASWVFGEDQILPLDFLMDLRAGSFAPTASYVIRRRVLENLPEWFLQGAPVADFFVERYAALRGGAAYFCEPMSVYRTMASGSWTERMRDEEPEYRAYVEGMLRAMALMAPDFAAFPLEMRRLRARFCLKYALEDILRGNDENFKRLIFESVESYRFVSRKQRIFYYFSFWPALLRKVLRVRRGL
ncbi:MAG: glycosyltransferase involved in cell wall biosynthesis [Halioglobus sp.]|jgi:glycosyltransferase involved in cell wall biosynthesis